MIEKTTDIPVENGKRQIMKGIQLRNYANGKNRRTGIRSRRYGSKGNIWAGKKKY